MKVYRLIAALLFAIAGQVFAADFAQLTGTYSGGGEWKDPEGHTGTWSEMMTCTSADGNETISEAITVVDENGTTETFNMSMTFVPTANGFYDVMTDGQISGHAYCFDKYCHIENRMGDSTDERTLEIGADAIHEMGSGMEVQADGTVKRFAWTGTLNMQAR